MAYPPSSTSSSLDLSPPVATVDEFAEFLSQEPEWYTLGVFLSAPEEELVRIRQIRSERIITNYIEMYTVLRSRRIPLSWDHIATALKRINRQDLADKIHEIYILPHLQRLSSESKKEDKPDPNSSSPVDTTVSIVKPTNSNDAIGSDEQSAETVKAITSEYTTLSEKFTIIKSRVRRVFKTSPNVDIEELQYLVRDQCGIEPQRHATVDRIFDKLEPCISILKFQIIIFLVESLLKNKKVIQKQVANFKQDVDGFKSSVKMLQLVNFIKTKQTIPGNSKMMQLKVREFWTDFTFKQFEKMVNEVLGTLYAVMSQMRVSTGCICISWVIPDIVNATKIVPAHSLEFIQLIGIISLHIGSNVIYNIEGEGCETIEAAMFQAIELKNTRAIELLLTMGCNPEVATYTGDNAVTTIVNIRESKKSSVDHVCIIGHNEHVEAIVDPTIKPATECSSCSINKKMTKQLLQQMESSHEMMRAKESEIEELTETVKNKRAENEEIVKHKDSENSTMKKTNELLIIDKNDKEKEISQLKNEIAKLLILKERITFYKSTAILPRQQLGIGAEMRLKIITRDNNGKEFDIGGSTVRAVLSCNKEECPVTNNNDGTYYVTVIPQQLGQHQLSITIDNQHIQNSPFSLTIVPQRDYTKLLQPVQIITNIKRPRYIAFSDNGDMFVTTDGDHCIHVYDKSGNKKTTIGSEGSGELQFSTPLGIDISGDIVYVSEWGNHRIHKLTTGGEFIDTFGEKGSGIGQFDGPCDVKISPDGKVFVSDTDNHRVQVFHSDWTVSHVNEWSLFDHYEKPEGIAFDLSGNIHVNSYGSNKSVSVVSSSRQFVRQYSVGSGIVGMAIDPSGYSLATSWSNNTLSVYNTNGVLVHTVKGFLHPYGVAVSPTDQSVWVVDTHNNRLLKY